MPLEPNTVLQNRYRIVRKLSAGGMGTVYEAIDLRFSSQVALKETHFTEEALRKQFEREAHLLYKMRHPAIARVIDHFTENDGQFLVMDYVEGEDLWEMLERQHGAFPVEVVSKWADQLLDALEYLHTQEPPIIHRDIKPQNLKLTARNQIILLDFGLAKGFAGQISRVTTSGSIFGYTPNYAPLEQIHGTGTDARSDIYSLAATLYHLLTGKVPPDALSRAMALTNEQPEPLRPAHEVNPNVPGEVASVLQKAMAQSANKRYASAVEMRQALTDTRQLISQGENQKIKQPPTMRAAPPLPLDFVRQSVKGEPTGEVISTLVATAPMTPPPQFTDSFHRPGLKSNRLPLMLVGIGVLVIIVLSIFITAKRQDKANVTANTNAVTANASTSVAKENNNQPIMNRATSIPSPTPAPVINLEDEDTVWKGKRDTNDEVFEFKKNGKMTQRSTGFVSQGTWAQQGDRVIVNISKPPSWTYPYKIEGTIQGDEMKGNFIFDNGPQGFVVHRVK